VSLCVCGCDAVWPCAAGERFIGGDGWRPAGDGMVMAVCCFVWLLSLPAFVRFHTEFPVPMCNRGMNYSEKTAYE
jgi:hypothetical protein